MGAKTLYEKLFDRHVVTEPENEMPLIYIDRHLVHEVTSPQAFDGLRQHGRKVRRPDKTFATMDHNVSTTSRRIEDASFMAKIQMETLVKNCQEFDVPLYSLDSEHQGIVHVIGPELGLTLPGLTMVCGDSHTATHGAFGVLAFGIGTSEVEHVLATQTLRQNRAKTMKIEVSGSLNSYLSAKDIILAIIAKMGTAGGTGHVVEYCGEAIRNLSMEGRMTICNMAIEMGAKAGLIAPDEKTFAYLKGREKAPQGQDWDDFVADCADLFSDEDAHWDSEILLEGDKIEPQLSWGTNPGQVISITDVVPHPDSCASDADKISVVKALQYMGLAPGQRLTDVKIDRVFIGSCTNSRIEDLRTASKIAVLGKVAKGVKAIVVPGSYQVRLQAEKEGLDKIFTDAGYEWRYSGCSMCLGMNEDQVSAFERCASTSNRNFEGRQGRQARTHLLSPAMAASAAIAGRFVDVRSFVSENRK